MRRIELNPLRAGMDEHPRDYPWSSYRHNALGETGRNLDWFVSHEEYVRLGRDTDKRRRAYRLLFRTTISARDLKDIRESTGKGWALGSKQSKEQIEPLACRRTVSKGVGRPKKLKTTSATNGV